MLGVSGGMPGNADSLAYLLPKMLPGSTWSITGIGRNHLPCMLLGLAEGCDGLRVGLEDNIFLEKGRPGHQRAAGGAGLQAGRAGRPHYRHRRRRTGRSSGSPSTFKDSNLPERGHKPCFFHPSALFPLPTRRAGQP